MHYKQPENLEIPGVSGVVQGSQEFHDHLPSVYLLMAQQAPAVVSSFALFLFIDLFLLAGYSASVHY